jgi:hypothetical protein
MNERRKRTCKTTLKLFTKQIHIVWNMNKNKMTILLSLNVIEAYDHVSKKDWFIIYVQNAFLNKSLSELQLDDYFNYFTNEIILTQNNN